MSALFRITKRTRGKHLMDGARQLWALIESGTHTRASLRRLLGVGNGTIERWLLGDRVPSLRSASIIEDKLSISTHAWRFPVPPNWLLPNERRIN